MSACWVDMLIDYNDGQVSLKDNLGQNAGISKINVVKAPLSSDCMERSEGLIIHAGTNKKCAKLDGVPALTRADSLFGVCFSNTWKPEANMDPLVLSMTHSMSQCLKVRVYTDRTSVPVVYVSMHLRLTELKN